MTCPKCGATNGEGVQFCTSCHATLIFKCPKCEHTQTHGGQCEACGMSFDAFWASYLAMKTEEEQHVARDRALGEVNKALTIATAPFAAGTSLSRFFLVQLLSRFFGRLRSR